MTNLVVLSNNLLFPLLVLRVSHEFAVRCWKGLDSFEGSIGTLKDGYTRWLPQSQVHHLPAVGQLRTSQASFSPYSFPRWITWASTEHSSLRELAFPGAFISREEDRNHKSSYDLASEVRQYYFCYILSIYKWIIHKGQPRYQRRELYKGMNIRRLGPLRFIFRE